MNETTGNVLAWALIIIALVFVYHYFTINIKVVVNNVCPEYRIRVGFGHYTFKDAAIYRIENIFVMDVLDKVSGMLTRELIKLIVKDFSGLERNEKRSRTYWRNIFLTAHLD